MERFDRDADYGSGKMLNWVVHTVGSSPTACLAGGSICCAAGSRRDGTRLQNRKAAYTRLDGPSGVAFSFSPGPQPFFSAPVGRGP
jgi:hypothetical protein